LVREGNDICLVCKGSGQKIKVKQCYTFINSNTNEKGRKKIKSQDNLVSAIQIL